MFLSIYKEKNKKILLQEKPKAIEESALRIIARKQMEAYSSNHEIFKIYSFL